jgi:hypothetical protein
LNKYLFRYLSILFFTALTLATTLVSLIQTRTAQKWVVDYAIKTYEENTSSQIKYESFDTSGFLSVQFKNLEISNNESEIISADETQVSYSLWRLLSKKLILSSIKIKNLRASDATLKQIPQQFHKNFPINITAQTEIDFTSQTSRTDIDFLRADDPDNLTHLSLRTSFKPDDRFKISARLEGNDHGVFKGLINKAEGHDFWLTIHSEANTEAWKSLLAFEASDSPFTGIFKFTLTPAYKYRNISFRTIIGDELKFESTYSAHTKGPIKLTDTALWCHVFRLDGALTLDETGKLTTDKSQFTLDLHKLKNFLPKQLKTKLHGVFDLSGTISDPKFSLSADNEMASIHINAETSSPTLFSAKLVDNSINGNLNLSPDNECLEGKVDFHLKDLLREGPLSGEIEFFQDKSDDTQSMSFKVEGNEINQKDFHIKSFSLDGQASGPWKTYKLNFQADKLSAMNQEWKQIKGSTEIDMDTDRWTYTLSAGKEDLAISSTGFWHKGMNKESALHLLVNSLEGEVKKHSFQLTSPVSFTLEDSTIAVSPFQLSMDEGKGSVKLALSDQDEGFLDFENIPLAVIHSVSDKIKIEEGNSSGQFTWTKVGDDRHCKGAFFFDSLVIKDHDPYSGSIYVDLSEQKMRCAVTVQEKEKYILDSEIILPISPKASLPDLNSPLEGHIKVKTDISHLLQLIYSDLHRFSGEADLDIELGGTLLAPTLDGNIQIEEGSYESLETGIQIKNFKGQIQSQGQTLYLKHFEATDGESGKISGSGTLELDYEDAFPYDIKAEFSEAIILHSDIAQLKGDGNLRFYGDAEAATLAGELSLKDSKITLPEDMPANLPPLEVTFVNPKNSVKTKKQMPKHKFPVAFDVELDAPKNLVITGKGLKSNWNGKLHLGGFIGSPLFYGDIKLDKGTFELSDQRFTLTDSTLSFDGDIRTQTKMNVSGEISRGGAMIHISLSGPLLTPNLSFYSSPALPEKEILSRLLFGKSAEEISPTEGVQLSQTLINLSGGAATPDFVTRFRKMLGLDRFDLSSNKNHEVSIQAGKYLTDGILLSMVKGVNSQNQRFNLEVDLGSGFKAEAEAGDGSKFFLKWKKEY